ncbi:Yip1 family protein [Sporosarcina luteola]|uniref:Yip1 family protein n=1 Tax=Sporosarcina luteola TaxID=582850 RepID=UPI00203B8D80|nr:Yip1 family protein [Sporosarcina luteola]MCM3711001.1 YIP1 family protein [Sporosarcina luteola]
MQNTENEASGLQLNPWTSVWLHPRKTVQYVMEYKTGSFVLMIAALTGIIHFLDQATGNDLFKNWNIAAVLLVALLAGPVIGVIGLYIASGIYHAFSLMLGGLGTFEETRRAFTVSSIIIIVGGLIWIPDLLILGQGNFSSDYDFSIGQLGWSMISLIVNFTVGIWSLIVLIAAIAEVHRFSAWKAALAVFLPIIILVVILLVIIGLTAPALF